ncbi:hypothetical protein BJ170DRAFT_733287 [Xylariales sp. AK1849]|nr:hypothetical protein BJ170DRAFT_733287 [Xylariales sp. AK1849]
MSGDHSTTPPIQPIILSMGPGDDDSSESEYRLQIGNQVKYLVISPGTFDRDTLSFPLQSLPRLPYNEEWAVAHISRDETSSDLKSSSLTRILAGLTAMAFEAVSNSILPITLPSPTTRIAKMARFEWELLRIEQETRAHQSLEGSGLTARFLVHVHENGRIHLGVCGNRSMENSWHDILTWGREPIHLFSSRKER